MADEAKKTPEKIDPIIKLEVNYTGEEGKYKLFISVGSPNAPDFKPNKVCKILIVDGQESTNRIDLNEFGCCEYEVAEFETKRKKVVVRVLDTIGNKQVDKTLTLRGPKKSHPPVAWGDGFLANLFPAIINLVIFIFVIVVTPIVCLTAGWWFLGSSVMLFIAILLALYCCPTARIAVQSGAGASLYRIGVDNNYRFFVLVGCAFISLALGIKYGGGEPVFVSTFRSSVNWLAKPVYTEWVQKMQNVVVGGINESNRTIQDKKSLLQQFQNDPVYTLRAERLKGESKQQYNERANNYITYGLFALDGKIAELIAGAKKPQENDARAEGTEWSRENKGWFFWKLLIIFLAMALLYSPFAFADEAADLFDGLAENLKQWRTGQGETQTAAESTPLSLSTPAGFLTRVGEIAGVDIGMELVYKTIKNFAEFLRR